MKMRRNGGFTLVELIMVVAIIAMISLLALNRLSGIRTDAKSKINVANMKRIDAAIETYLTANVNKGLNRLDALIKYGEGSSSEGSTSGLNAPLEIVEPSLGLPTNRGLYTNLVSVVSQYSMTFPPILGKYYLTAAEAAALSDFGMKYAMRGTDGNRMRAGDDKAWAKGAVNNPDTCCCVATLLTNSVAVAVVNPGAVTGSGRDISPVGANIYQSAGQAIYYTSQGKFVIDEVEYADNESAFRALRDSDKYGIILAFGLGEFASLLGDNKGGLDIAPICPDIQEDVYRRYLVLLRLRRSSAFSSGYTVEYAGIMDPRGRTLRELVNAQ